VTVALFTSYQNFTLQRSTTTRLEKHRPYCNMSQVVEQKYASKAPNMHKDLGSSKAKSEASVPGPLLAPLHYGDNGINSTDAGCGTSSFYSTFLNHCPTDTAGGTDNREL
jgi:hypothetical protein